jgi:hypothetical protein
VLQRLAAAKKSIHFMTFSYTADSTADAMIAKVKAGLVVRGVFESQNANGSGADCNPPLRHASPIARRSDEANDRRPL